MKHAILPSDPENATLVGRIWLTDKDPTRSGPCIVTIQNGDIHDLTPFAATCAQLMSMPDRLEIISKARRETPICSLDGLLESSTPDLAGSARTHLLSPVDLQCIKAAGVTFIESLLERMIEERAGGDPGRAVALREKLTQSVGDELSKIKADSTQARQLEARLKSDGLWSQYLEVGIGRDAEIFTKAPVLSSVGYGQYIGINRASEWNNPEPEVVLVVNRDNEIVGATLGNDVNLRDFEGRSALLLARGKDNNASCALGPFIRLFDDNFRLDDVRQLDVTLRVEGDDGFSLDGQSSMSAINRDIEDLVGQTAGDSHQYPDGFVLMTGTLFAPTQDRDAPGMGFTHHAGDRVVINSNRLGTLLNTVTGSDQAPAWTFGIAALIANLRGRELI